MQWLGCLYTCTCGYAAVDVQPGKWRKHRLYTCTVDMYMYMNVHSIAVYLRHIVYAENFCQEKIFANFT